MSEVFYKVAFINSDEEHFFHSHEEAAAFLLEAYFEDNEIVEEEYIIDINNQVADNDEIEGYGQILDCWFDD